MKTQKPPIHVNTQQALISPARGSSSLRFTKRMICEAFDTHAEWFCNRQAFSFDAHIKIECVSIFPWPHAKLPRLLRPPLARTAQAFNMLLYINISINVVYNFCVVYEKFVFFFHPSFSVVSCAPFASHYDEIKWMEKYTYASAAAATVIGPTHQCCSNICLLFCRLKFPHHFPCSLSGGNLTAKWQQHKGRKTTLSEVVFYPCKALQSIFCETFGKAHPSTHTQAHQFLRKHTHTQSHGGFYIIFLMVHDSSLSCIIDWASCWPHPIDHYMYARACLPVCVCVSLCMCACLHSYVNCTLSAWEQHWNRAWMDKYFRLFQFTFHELSLVRCSNTSRC